MYLRLSSEDSGEICAYIEDSDESEQMELESQSPGQMDLLGEILDTLSTHSSDQGKLCAAKSLDFFKSMDDISYKTRNKSNTPSEGNLAELGGQCNDHLSWHLGQDDTIVHRKPLPPSPRKSFYGCSEDPITFEATPCESSTEFVEELTDFPKLHNDSSCKDSLGTHSSCKEMSQEVKVSAKQEPKRTLTSEDKQQCENTPKNPSALIPWEKDDVEAELLEPTSEIDLLKEIDCLCSRIQTGHTTSSVGASTTNT